MLGGKTGITGRVAHLLNTEVYKKFMNEGIEIPFPQRDLYIKSAPATAPIDL